MTLRSFLLQLLGARVKGFTLPINYKLSIPSAQIKSSILLAALTARGTSFITEYKKSRNYTEKMLSERGVILKNKKINKNKNIISIKTELHLSNLRILKFLEIHHLQHF